MSTALTDHYRSCDLCPHECGVNRCKGEVGICGASDELVLGRAALHWWEEPCLVGEQGSGAVFFSHCSLKCVYCQNYELAHGRGIKITQDRLRDIFLELQNDQGAANLNLVTPTQYLPQIVETLKELKGDGAHAGKLNIPVVYNTSGYERAEIIRALDGLVDIYLTDYKYASADLAHNLSKAKKYPEVALEAIDEMLRQVGAPSFDEKTGLLRKGVLVRHLILPGHVEESCSAVRLLWQRFGKDILLSIMGQYTPLSSIDKLSQFGLDTVLAPEEYEAVLSYADSLGIEDYFWQEGGSCEESFIPAFDGQGVMA